jgi:hypothetical protein
MKFVLVVQAELPFMLNLDSRSFSIAVSGGSVVLDVDNEAHVVKVQNPSSPEGVSMLIGGLSDLAAMLQTDAGRLPATKLRTVVRAQAEREVDEAALPPVPATELTALMMSELVRSSSPVSQDQLEAAANDTLSKMSPEHKAAFLLRERQRRYGQGALSKLQDDFVTALNRLIRWYSVDCSDFFVEEVGLHQLAATTTRGVLRTSSVDGKVIETIPVVGKIPPLMTRAWLKHPPATLATLEAHLLAADDPDFARVLVIRARHLLERTAFRNAIAEAAASLEVAVARAIRRKMNAAGKTDAQVDTELEITKMNFPQRAEHYLKKWCTYGVLELDAGLWAQLKTDRIQFRNQVVHSDREPLAAEAHDVVERSVRMTELVLSRC